MTDRATLVLDDQQAAALFRLCISNGLAGCQHEFARMRWWLPQGLILELIEGAWHLSVQKTRRCGLPEVDDLD